MKKLGFPSLWVDNVMRCVKSVSYSVKFNGEVTKVFHPERGIR